MMDRQGIEIDYCPQCRGVWLDRGELDKLIEAGSGGRPEPDRPREPQREQRYDERPYRSDDDYKYHKKKKKGGFLGELFDFD